MGKSQKPLSILVTDSTLYASEHLQALAEKGHTVTLADLSGYDVVIGPRCWRIIPEMGEVGAQIAMMLAGVWAIKYPKADK